MNNNQKDLPIGTKVNVVVRKQSFSGPYDTTATGMIKDVSENEYRVKIMDSAIIPDTISVSKNFVWTDDYKYFPNGFKSWMETHYEIVSSLTQNLISNNPSPVLLDERERAGSAALVSLAESWTDEFEQINKNRFWDGEFYEEIDQFAYDKLYPNS